MAKSPRLNKLHICGPGLSVCCSVISVWGIIMLVSVLIQKIFDFLNSKIMFMLYLKAIVGGLMSAKSAAFLEDIPMSEEGNRTFAEELDHGFATAATNCYGAVGLYGACLIFCIIQVWFNVKVASMKQQ